MRRLKRISFFLYSCLLFAVGFYGHYKIEQWFYPGRQTIISQNEIPFFQMQSATQAVSVPDRLRADTKLVVKIPIRCPEGRQKRSNPCHFG